MADASPGDAGGRVVDGPGTAAQPAAASSSRSSMDAQRDDLDLAGPLPGVHRYSDVFARRASTSRLERHPAATLVAVLALGWLAGLFCVWPFPTTVHALLALVVALLAWTALQWAALLQCLVAVLAGPRSKRSSHAEHSRPLLGHDQHPLARPSRWNWLPAEWSRSRRLAVLGASMLSIAILTHAAPPREAGIPVPNLIPSDPSIPEKYFIAANLYNNEEIFGEWSSELVRLCRHLGENNVFISIAESNSKDRTQVLLAEFDKLLSDYSIPHRITSETNNDRWWPYGTSPERISYLAGVRNKALEPIQSEDDSRRLEDAPSFTKIVFLNDIYFSWQSIVRLLATRLDGRNDLPPDYDLACAFDYGESGLYDTWVARDICGAPMRTFWPYAKDPETIEKIRQEVPVEVGACWNGAVAFPAEPYIRKQASLVQESIQKPKQATLPKRGWRMMDNATYDHTLHSPAIPSPVKFRGPSYTDACDHSEAFLWSYDMHRRLKEQRRPRIIMNPAVKVAYSLNWYRWRNSILRIPFVRFWQRIWSHGLPFWFVDWIFERAGRRSDYCTWAGLQIPDRCPPIPRPVHRGWENG